MMKLLLCKYCGRDNFKSQRGLTQHIQASKYCRAQVEKEIAASCGVAAAPGAEKNHTHAANALGSLVHMQHIAAASKIVQVQMDQGQLDASTELIGNVDVQHNRMDVQLDQNAVQEQQNFQVADDDDNPPFDDDSSAESNAMAHEVEEDDDPARSNIKQFRAYVQHAKQNFMEFNKDEVAAIKLMNVLRKKNTTLDTYDAIMEWHLRESGVLEDHQRLGATRRYISREKLLQKLAHRYNRDPKKLVSTKPTVLPNSKAKLDLIVANARDNVVSILTDPRWNAEDFLFFDDDPFAPPPKRLDYIADINTGLAYTETHKQLITKPGKQILCPIPLYIDGAVTGQFDKLEITPLKMTLGILNRRARDKEYAWRVLGYVPDHARETSRCKAMYVQSNHVAARHYDLYEDEGTNEKLLQPVHKMQDFHAVLDAILESLVQLQEEGLVWDFYYRGKLYKDVEFVFFVPHVLVDTDEADKLCGSYRSRAMGVAQLCHYCCCPTDESDDPRAAYDHKTKTMITELVEDNNKVALKEISQQYLPMNAWYKVRFGLHNDRNIHGATPIEILHAVLLGHFKCMRDCWFAQVGAKSDPAEELNALAKLYGELYQRQSLRDLPKTNFSKGINKGKIMGKEFNGVLLIMATIMHSALGREILMTKPKSKKFAKEYLLQDWIMLIETLLQWECFLKLDVMEKNHVKRLKKKHQYLMYLMKKVGNRTKGMGLKLIKFHAILHIWEDILIHGVPINVDTGTNESHHKLQKAAARLTQRILELFEVQTAKRIEEFRLVELAMMELAGYPLWEYFDGNHMGAEKEAEPDLPRKQPASKTGGTRIRVWKDPDLDTIAWGISRTKSCNPSEAGWDRDVLAFLDDAQYKLRNWIPSLDIRTEHKRNGQIFRGHPNYRSSGQWNDWVLVDWGANGHTPAEIWCFLDLRDLPKRGIRMNIGGCQVKGGVYAVVEHADEPEDVNDQLNLDMFTKINKFVHRDDDGRMTSRAFYLADVEAFVEAICVVPNVGAARDSEYFMVKARSRWSDDFIKWVKADHRFDDMTEEDDAE